MRLVLRGVLLCGLVLLARSATGAPIAIPLAAFDGTETVIGFETVGQNVEITNQFAALGVVFSGGLHGDSTPSNVDDFSSPGSVIAGNFTFNGFNSFGSIEVAFAAPVTRVGFFGVSAQSMFIEAFRGGASLGTFVFAADANPPDVFMGLGDPMGIDALVIGSTTYAYFEIDDFRFQTVPEPGMIWLMATGLAAALPLRRRARR